MRAGSGGPATPDGGSGATTGAGGKGPAPTALVTGASGIVGANLVRELLSSGWRVRALVRPGPPRRALLGLPVEMVEGDVLNPGSLPAALEGVSVVFHAAARFTYDAPDPAEMERVAVDGSRNVIRAAGAAGVGRVVLTSSSVVFGSSPDRAPRTERSPFTPEDGSAYAISKVRQSRAARSEAEIHGVDLLEVCPTLALGPWDYRLAESNAILVNYLNDPYRSTFPGGCNVVSARDVARGHLMVALRGTPGEAYLVGGENLDWSELHTLTSGLCGTHGPLVTASHTGAYLAAAWGEMWSRFTGAPRTLTRDQVRMMGRWYWYDDAKVRALGYAPESASPVVAGALRWLLRTDHIRSDVRALLRWPEGEEARGPGSGTGVPPTPSPPTSSGAQA